MPLYFAYGSNLKRERLLERVTGALPAGIAWLADFAVVFDKRGADGTPKANLAPRFGARTWGALYALSEEDFDRLDRYERGYARLAVTVIGADGAPVPALTYRSERLLHGVPPADAYLRLVLEGAREHGLPEEHLRALTEAAAPTPRAWSD
jgi:hypothetical protein